MSFETPLPLPERTPEEVKEAKLVVAKKAFATAWAYLSEAAYHPEGSERRELLERYGADYERAAKALLEAANR